ncbi:MAG: hypothetical protein HY547_04000 [Elusimicrobia bacterium]|nr:hypothetical protein [Elusimicrobiota bacterium]
MMKKSKKFSGKWVATKKIVSRRAVKSSAPARLVSVDAQTFQATGSYVFDKQLGRVVKVSHDIPSVASRDGADVEAVGPCGRTECGGGSCAAGGPKFN